MNFRRMLFGVLAMLSAGVVQAAGVLIDVRTPEEFAGGHLPGAINIEYDRIGAQIGRAGVAKGDEVIVYCRSGRRSAIARQTLEAQGYTRVLDYGGFEAAARRLQAEGRKAR